ncbi:DUF6415 family natural product biosynthesis protein [Streptomyces sp. bgisy091]|uniref:DUF6415 family natural product biosynthesis protein n=1 Tax=Streptomyces sp. bgisy091 TaxID=3413778 RepID=UPI003D7414D9
MTEVSVELHGLVVLDPDGARDREVPLDRNPIMMLATAVLALPVTDSALPPRDCEQIARLLAGHARLVANEVSVLCSQLPDHSPQRPLTEIVLGESRRRLSVDPHATLASVHNHARLVRMLYERLDRLQEARQGRDASS